MERPNHSANETIRGARVYTNRLVMQPSPTQTLVATTAILVREAFLIRVVGTGGVTTLTATPTIADGFDGQLVLLRGMSDANAVVVQDVSSLAGSNVDLGGANRTLGAGDYLLLCFNETTSLWEEVVFKNN